MTNDNNTPPAPREFCVYATDVLFQNVEASSAEEAYRLADEDPRSFEPCGSCLALDRDVKDVEADEYVRVGPPAAPCKTCGSEVVATVNGSNFAEGECGACEYRRYATQAELLALASAFRQECSERIQQYRDDIKEDFGDPRDLRERVRYWQKHRNRCDAVIAKANG
ncbi:MAG: hypothetical protein ACRC33_29850 [Gemmataceae bacterium]